MHSNIDGFEESLKQLETLNDVLLELTSLQLRWAFARDRRHTAESLIRGPDVDIWVEKKAFMTVIWLFVGNGFEIVQIRTDRNNLDHLSSGFVRFRPILDQGAQLVEVHFGHYWSTWGPILREEEILADLVLVEGRPFFGLALLASINSTRLLAQGRLRGARLIKSSIWWQSETTKSVKNQWRAITEARLGLRVRRSLERALSSAEAPSLWITLLCRLRLAHRKDFVAQVFTRLDGALKTFLRANRIMLVGVIGVDGSGKSSLVRGIEGLSSEYSSAITSIYAGRVRGNVDWVEKLRNKVQSRMSSDSHASQKVDSHTSHVSGKVRLSAISFGTLAIYWLDYWARLKGVLRDSSHPVVLLDRGPDDLITVPAPLAFRWGAIRSLPRRHLVLLCDAPESEIFARKPERSKTEISARQALYRFVLRRRGKGNLSVVINTSSPLRESVLMGYIIVSIAKANFNGRIPNRLARNILTELSRHVQ